MAPGACNIKHYGNVIYRKWADFVVSLCLLACTNKPLNQTNTLAYYGLWTLRICNVFIVQAPGTGIIKLIAAVIYGFRNKQECLSLKIRLGWKGLPGTNTIAYYRNSK
jgi:hypothetical protein